MVLIGEMFMPRAIVIREALQVRQEGSAAA